MRGYCDISHSVLAIWVAWYKFVGINLAISIASCMAAGITSMIWTRREMLTAMRPSEGEPWQKNR